MKGTKKPPSPGLPLRDDGDKEHQQGTPTMAGKSSRWFAFALADDDRLRNNRTGATYSIMLAIWVVLAREAFFKRSLTVTLSDQIIAQRAGLNRRTVLRHREDLIASGLVHVGPPARDKATCRYLPMKWTLKPSRKPFMASPSDSKSPGPCDSKSPGPCDSEYTTQSHRLLQSSSGGFQKPSRLEEETVRTSRGRRSPSVRKGRAEAAFPTVATPPVKQETEIDALRAWQKEEYQ